MLSVIVPVWNNTPELARMTEDNLDTLNKLKSVPTQLDIIDNGSPYPARSLPYGSMYIEWDSNRGIAPAWNYGASHSDQDVLCFLNTDCVVEEGWDSKLVEVALAGPYIAMPYTNGAKSDGIGITGWCFAISRDMFYHVGPFDETFVPAYYEDTDFFHRAIQKGMELVNVPGANVLHERGTSTREAPWYKNGRDILFMANRLRYAWKHGLDHNAPPHFWTKPLRDYDANS